MEIDFPFEGRRRTETIPCKTTVKAVKDAERLRDAVRTAIKQRIFDYKVFFPYSLRALGPTAPPPDELTVGMCLDKWLSAGRGSFSHNTREDYVRLIRNQLKPLLLNPMNFADEQASAKDKALRAWALGRWPVGRKGTSVEEI